MTVICMIKPWTEVKLLHFKTRSHWSDDTLSFIADNGNPNPSVRLPFRIMNKATKEIVSPTLALLNLNKVPASSRRGKYFINCNVQAQYNCQWLAKTD